MASLSGSVGGQAREGGAALDDGATSWHLLWFWLGGKVVIIITWSLGKPDNRGLFRAMSPGQRTVRSTGSKVRQAGKLLRAKYSVAVSGLRTAVTSSTHISACKPSRKDILLGKALFFIPARLSITLQQFMLGLQNRRFTRPSRAPGRQCKRNDHYRIERRRCM